MRENIIRAVVYEDGRAEWKDGNELKDGVNIHLNVHQKARQIVEAELGDFLLNEGEWILAAFERVENSGEYHINPARMDRSEKEGNVFRLRIPSLVHNTPGNWKVQFYLITGYDGVTGAYDAVYPFDIVLFREFSSLEDDGLEVPSEDNMKALRDEVLAAANNKVDKAGDEMSGPLKMGDRVVLTKEPSRVLSVNMASPEAPDIDISERGFRIGVYGISTYDGNRNTYMASYPEGNGTLALKEEVEEAENGLLKKIGDQKIVARYDEAKEELTFELESGGTA